MIAVLLGFLVGSQAAFAEPAVLPAVPVPERAVPDASLRAWGGEPDFLTDTDALEALPARIRAACAWTGRIQYLHFDANHVAIVIAEIEGGGLDTVVFSFGQVVRAPRALTTEELERLPSEVFVLEERHLRAIPKAVEAAIQANPLDTTVDHVALIGIAGPPRMQIAPVHPRKVIEPIETPL